jgi:Lipocalin-like domain
MQNERRMTTNGNPLLGTWKLRSYVVTTGTGEASTPYGERPSGYITYSADMRMQVIGTADVRVAPHDPILADGEQVELFKTMFAYAGTYSPEAGKVTHHVDISWNEIWTGTDQVRFYEINENNLTITSRLIDPTSGTEAE